MQQYYYCTFCKPFNKVSNQCVFPGQMHGQTWPKAGLQDRSVSGQLRGAIHRHQPVHRQQTGADPEGEQKHTLIRVRVGSALDLREGLRTHTHTHTHKHTDADPSKTCMARQSVLCVVSLFEMSDRLGRDKAKCYFKSASGSSRRVTNVTESSSGSCCAWRFHCGSIAKHLVFAVVSFSSRVLHKDHNWCHEPRLAGLLSATVAGRWGWKLKSGTFCASSTQ